MNPANDEKEAQQAPDVSSDRAPPADAKPQGNPNAVKKPPLAIEEIEDLEDDAKGG